MNLRENFQRVQGTVKEMDETPKKLCNRKVNICRCCNSHLSNVYDSIDLFGKTAQRENVIEKLKEVGKFCSAFKQKFSSFPAFFKADTTAASK